MSKQDPKVRLLQIQDTALKAQKICSEHASLDSLHEDWKATGANHLEGLNRLRLGMGNFPNLEKGGYLWKWPAQKIQPAQPDRFTYHAGAAEPPRPRDCCSADEAALVRVSSARIQSRPRQRLLRRRRGFAHSCSSAHKQMR